MSGKSCSRREVQGSFDLHKRDWDCGNNMNHKHLLIAFVVATLSACATSAPPPTRVAFVAPSAPAVTAPVAMDATATQANYDPRRAESDRKAKELGYHIVMRGGDQYYCRTVAPMGTRIPQKECLRADALQQQLRRMEEDKINIRQFQYCGPACVPPANAQ
jgi:hypothetical protein